MSRRRTKRPDGTVYRELRKRPLRGQKRVIRYIELMIIAVVVLGIAAVVYWWFRR